MDRGGVGGGGREMWRARCETLIISEEETWTASIAPTKRVNSPLGGGSKRAWPDRAGVAVVSGPTDAINGRHTGRPAASWRSLAGHAAPGLDSLAPSPTRVRKSRDLRQKNPRQRCLDYRLLGPHEQVYSAR